MDQAIKNEIIKLIDERFLTIIDKLAQLDEIQKSVSWLSECYDELNTKMESNQKQINSLDNDRKKTKENCVKLSNELAQLKSNLDEMEQYIRRESLEIRGIPVTQDEDTSEIVRKIGDLIDVDIEESDISVSHRLPPPKNNHFKQLDPAIVVKFVRRDVRDQLYSARKHLRDKSTTDLGFERRAPRKIYISESLTRSKHSLLNQCLKKKKELNYRFLWTHYGKILMRKNGSSSVITITSEKDFDKLS